MNLRPRHIALVLCALCWSAGAQLQTINYHGRLLSNGVPLNGIYDVTVGIWDAYEQGALLRPPSTNLAVEVRSGAVSLPLDFSGVLLDGSPRWLEIAVRTNGATGYATLKPRQPLTVVPQALYAVSAGSSMLATNLADGGATLSMVPANRLVGEVPLAALAGITSNQIAPATDALYRADQSLRGVVTPFETGAVGDGNTDDTAALQRWINRAASEGLIAFLPPAPGGWYRITDTLYASNSITMFGGGGGKHSTSFPYSRSMIRQFTPGRHGLVLLSANDSVRLASFIIRGPSLTNTPNSGSYGIWFAGGAADVDCAVVEQCMVMGFGVGVMAASQAVTTFRQCSFGFNGTGVQISGIANNISFDSCQLSQNFGRQVYLQAGAKVIIQNSDIGAGADGTLSAQGIYCSASQDLTIMSSRFEDYSTNACLTVGNGSRVTLMSVAFHNFSRVPRYSVVATNTGLTILNCEFGCIGPTGAPIFELGTGSSSVVAIPPVRTYVSIGRDGFLGTASVLGSGRAGWTGGGPGPGGVGRQGSEPGLLQWGWGLGPDFSDHALWAYANMGQAGYSGLQAVDLLDFAKQQRTGLRGNGANLTNLNGANLQPRSIKAEQLDPTLDALYRNANALTNNQATPVTLGKDLSVLGDLRLPSGSLIVKTNAKPSGNTPQAWFEIKDADGKVWKVGLYK